MKRQREIILGSASPSRQALLKQLGLVFTVDPSQYDEAQQDGLAPRQLVRVLSQAKAQEVAQRHANAVIIAADTIAVLNGAVLGKPKTKTEAKRMLKRMSGKRHTSITGYTVLDTATQRRITKVVETMVIFRRLSAAEINRYVATGEPMGKAAAYAIQGYGALLVKKVIGDPYVVMGLPLSALAESLRKIGMTIL